MNIEKLLDRTSHALKQADYYANLPGIQKNLVLLQTENNKERRKHIASALGRLVMEDYHFSESQLGIDLLDFVNEIL